MNAPLLSTQKISQDNAPFPAYLVASTAPINVEDKLINRDSDFTSSINDITHHLKTQKSDAEILIVIHGYNNNEDDAHRWFESVYQHLASHHHHSRPSGFVLIGYRWPSEKVIPPRSKKKKKPGNLPSEAQTAHNSLSVNLKHSIKSLPIFLGGMFNWAIIVLVMGVIGLGTIIGRGFFDIKLPLALFLSIAILAIVFIMPILTILMFRLTVYFRDSYRATNFGVTDLVELIRHIDNDLIQSVPVNEHKDKEAAWHQSHQRIKLSFIGHSMGAFVVTNAVRILSDVFDPVSVGSIDTSRADKNPSRNVGNVFSLGRLVLVAPDIPADTIISGRTNVLSSSLRRFEEAYLFSNEGDMALRLASTAANYFSYPANTQQGGYRLGNVAISNSRLPGEDDNAPPQRKESYGVMARLADKQLVCFDQDRQEVNMPGFPLDYLYIGVKKSLSKRQKDLINKDHLPSEGPIGEKFTFFDCTDYVEITGYPGHPKTPGLLSQAKQKSALTLVDYFCLSIDYFKGKVDTHGGYFSNRAAVQKKHTKPEAAFSKLAIYGIAALGFEKFLLELRTEPISDKYQTSFEQILQDIQSKFPHIPQDQQQKKALNQTLSSMCRDRGIQVLLAQDRYS
jgi:Alpha/beta hydrolase of unknown function (DUF900)